MKSPFVAAHGTRPDLENAQPLNLKSRKSLTGAAGLLFAVSFLLPSFEGSTSFSLSGFDCLRSCILIMLRTSESATPSLGSWLYYSGFVAANLVFVAVWIAAFFSTACAGFRRWASALTFTQVLSWLVLNLVMMGKGDKLCLEIGYFTWLLAFGLLFFSQVFRPLPWISTDAK